MEKENKQLKSSVFADLFQECPEAKENALSLFNALEGTNYTDPSIINHFRIEDTIYKDSKNDVSFTVDNRMIVLMEHQSTINANMPLRCLIYVGRLYEKIIPAKSRYKEYLVQIPTPEFFVFYNGMDDYPSEITLKLSDAFITQPEVPALEVLVHVININPDKNNDILKKCAIINEYSEFIEVVRKHEKNKTEQPYKAAIRECIEKGILADYLRREGHDVETFLQAKYDRELDLEVKAEEAFENGVQQGISQGITQGITQGINESVSRYIRKQRLKGTQDEQILTDIVDTFELSEADAKTLLKATTS